MLLKDLIEKVDIIKINADVCMDITGVNYDTRVIRDGEIFVAVKGYETDGHMFINEAVSKGAICIVCEQPLETDIAYIVVNDSRKALAMISAAWFCYPAEKLIMVGVTGTNGKTSVTNFIKHIIEKCSNKKVGLIGTNGNFIGERELSTEHTTPESYELQKLLDKMVLEGCKYVIMEVSSHALYLSRVFGIIYDIGIFTNLTSDHLDFHGTMDEYACAKTILFKQSKKSVINIDDKSSSLMIHSSAGPVTTYAVNDSSADLVGKDVKLQAEKIDFCILTVGRINRIELPIPALFSVYNALAAIAATSLLGFDIENTVKSLKSYSCVKGRAEVITTGLDYTVLIDYAHTPDALKNIITSVREFAKGRVVTLFGCGGDRDKSKRPVMGKIATQLSDFTVITSDNPRTEIPHMIIDNISSGIDASIKSFKIIENRYEAIRFALDSLDPGDVLIIAGKGHETYQILGKEKIHFDDREVVTGYVKELRIESRKKKIEGLD